ncbi:hypothetical protein ACFLT9_02665 [Acidobacteriota bacterium]
MSFSYNAHLSVLNISLSFSLFSVIPAKPVPDLIGEREARLVPAWREAKPGFLLTQE